MTVFDSQFNLHSQFQELLDSTEQRLARYIENADEEAIHDVRTSLRRLRTAYRSFPPACCTAESAMFMQSCREFFCSNSQIRDCDVIRGKFLGHGIREDDKLIKLLDRSREELLRHAMDQAVALREMPGPVLLAAGEDAYPSFLEQLDKHAARFLANLPQVVAREADSEAIHAMRKEAKKLFYLLEMDPELAELRRMIHIKQFQRLSGDLHDCDIAIEFLKEHDGLSSSQAILLESEELTRHILYTELCGLLQGEDWQALLTLE